MRLGYTACWIGILAVGLALLVAPASNDAAAVHGVGVVVTAGAFFFALRAWRWATIEVRPDRIVVHELIHTLRLPRAEIDRFVAVRNVLSSDPLARFLAVRTIRGDRLVFGDFSSDGGFSIDGLAARLNADIGSTSSDPRLKLA